MKKISCLVLVAGVAFFIVCCKKAPLRESKKTSEFDTKEYYYSKINKKDSTLVYLAVNGEDITGKMLWLPYEKDSKEGVLSGRSEKGVVSLIFHYYQEGNINTDSMIVALNSGHLIIKRGWTIDPENKKNIIPAPYVKDTLNETNNAVILERLELIP